MRLFFDTNVLIRAVTGTDKDAVRLLFHASCEKFTNKYVIGELRRVLKTAYRLSDVQVDEYRAMIAKYCKITSNPHPNIVKLIEIRDKSDKIIVASARELGCILISEDTKLLEDALKYVEAERISDVTE